MKNKTGMHRGVNLGGWLSQCDYSADRLNHFIKEEDFAVIASWGLDHVRIPVDFNVLEDDNNIADRYNNIVLLVRNQNRSFIAVEITDCCA